MDGTDGAISEVKDFEAMPAGNNTDEANFHSENRKPMQSHFKFADSSGGQQNSAFASKRVKPMFKLDLSKVARNSEDEDDDN